MEAAQDYPADSALACRKSEAALRRVARPSSVRPLHPAASSITTCGSRAEIAKMPDAVAACRRTPTDTHVPMLCESHLVQSDQLAPRAFGFGPAVDRRAVFSRHIRHAPTVPGWIDFDFRRDLRRGKRFSELVFRVRLALVIVRCDSEVHPRLDFRRKQMRAVRLIRDQTAPVEGGAGANTSWKCGGCLHDQRSAHAVTLGPD